MNDHFFIVKKNTRKSFWVLYNNKQLFGHIAKVLTTFVLISGDACLL
jgi:hypothetical protein